MGFNGIRRVLKEAFINIFRNPLISLASVTAMVSTLLILGVVMCVLININSVLGNISSNLEIVAFLDEGLDDNAVALYAKEVEQLNGVQAVAVLTAEEALEKWREELGDEDYILSAYDEDNNPVPASYTITLTTPEDSETVLQQLDGLTYIRDVQYNKEFIESVMTLAWGVKIIGFSLLGILCAVSMVVTTNAVRMSIYSRRYEIRIMKYVGATNGYIRRPFVVEGIVLGFFAAAIAFGLIVGGYLLFLDKIQLVEQQKNILGVVSWVEINEIYRYLVIGFLTLSAGVSGLSSGVTTRRHLNV